MEAKKAKISKLISVLNNVISAHTFTGFFCKQGLIKKKKSSLSR